MIFTRLFLMVALALFFVEAQAFRCDGKLVSEGMSQYQVRSVCGEPDDIHTITVFRSFSRQINVNTGAVGYGASPSYREEVVVPVVIEVWTYNLGPQRFIREVRFELGRVVDVGTADYGD